MVIVLQKNAITKVADPVHVEPTDLDGDGTRDYVVADIGFMNPSNQSYGTLWWVHRSTVGNAIERRSIERHHGKRLGNRASEDRLFPNL